MFRNYYYMLLAVFFFLGSCGYHISGGTETPSLITGKTIAIPMWRSKGYRPNLEAVLTGMPD